MSRCASFVVGSAVAGRGGGGVENQPGLADRVPEGQLFLVLTDQRLFVASVSARSGKPKEVVAEWARTEVTGIEVEKGRMASPLTIEFADGSAVQVEGAKGTNPEGVAEAFSA